MYPPVGNINHRFLTGWKVSGRLETWKHVKMEGHKISWKIFRQLGKFPDNLDLGICNFGILIPNNNDVE